MLAIAFLGMLAAWLRGAMRDAMKEKRAWWLPLALILPAVLFLLFPVSEPVWNWAPQRCDCFRLPGAGWWFWKLRWPCSSPPLWRYFAEQRELQSTPQPCAVVFAAISIGAYGLWFTDCGEGEQSIQRQIKQGIGVLEQAGVPRRLEFAMLRWDRSVHDACLLDAESAGHAC